MALQKHMPLIAALLLIVSAFTWPAIAFDKKQRATKPLTLESRFRPLAEISVAPSATPR